MTNRIDVLRMMDAQTCILGAGQSYCNRSTPNEILLKQ